MARKGKAAKFGVAVASRTRASVISRQVNPNFTLDKRRSSFTRTRVDTCIADAVGKRDWSGELGERGGEGREFKRTTESRKKRGGRETGALPLASSLFRAGVCWVVAVDVAIGPGIDPGQF